MGTVPMVYGLWSAPSQYKTNHSAQQCALFFLLNFSPRTFSQVKSKTNIKFSATKYRKSNKRI